MSTSPAAVRQRTIKPEKGDVEMHVKGETFSPKGAKRAKRAAVQEDQDGDEAIKAGADEDQDDDDAVQEQDPEGAANSEDEAALDVSTPLIRDPTDG